jgi:glutaredoxin
MNNQCDVKLYALSTCIHCRDTKEFLNQCGIKYQCIEVDKLDLEQRRKVLEELKEIKPECAYFGDADGKRTGFLVVNLEGLHKIPAIAEPWFLAFNASVQLTPVMTAEDLQKAGPDIERAAKKYGA